MVKRADIENAAGVIRKLEQLEQLKAGVTGPQSTLQITLVNADKTHIALESFFSVNAITRLKAYVCIELSALVNDAKDTLASLGVDE